MFGHDPKRDVERFIEKIMGGLPSYRRDISHSVDGGLNEEGPIIIQSPNVVDMSHLYKGQERGVSEVSFSCDEDRKSAYVYDMQGNKI